MERFKNILVVASPGHLEPLTLKAAINLAHTNGAQLTVVDVVAPLPRWRKTVDRVSRGEDVEALLLADREEQLRQLVDNAGTASITDLTVTVGEPFLDVIRHVLVHGNDLVIVGWDAPEKGTVPQLSTGVMRLLRKCPVPVWVMRPSRAEKLRTLALVDPDPWSPDRNDLSDLVMELATSVTRRECGDLHVGHAWQLEGESTMRSSPFIRVSDAAVDDMVQNEEKVHREQVEALAARHHVSELGGEVHVLSGDPHEVLPRLADRLDIGLIVMGTVARTGLSGLLMGNTAESVLRAVQCSVLAVKPEGFVTPVKLPHSST